MRALSRRVSLTPSHSLLSARATTEATQLMRTKLRGCFAAPALLLSLSLLAGASPAQIVHFANFSATPFFGWKRTTIDVAPPHAIGQVGDVLYAVGRQVGADTHVLDVRIALAPWERRTIDFANAHTVPWSLPPVPPIEMFGGGMSIANVPLALVGLQPDGAGWSAHLRARAGSTLVVDVWTTLYPEQPGFAHGEVVVTSSHPQVTAIDETLPPDFKLRFGDALVYVPGAGIEAPIVPAGTKLVDGQGRAVPVLFLWPRHMHTAAQWNSANALVNPGVGAVGIRNLLPFGNPVYPPSFSSLSWMASRFGEAMRVLHTWEPGVCGPDPNSSVSGEQTGEQIFVRGEALLQSGVGAEVVTWLSGLKMAGRPCHYHELNGAQVRWEDHPNTVMWSGRPHFNQVICPDQLGAETLTLNNLYCPVPGGGSVLWNGPDDEHWMYNTVAAGARLTGSFALQHELFAQGTLYMLTSTVPSLKPGWATNVPGSARSVGYAGMLVTRLHHALEDRALAAAMVQRWQLRVSEVYEPILGNKPNDVWDLRLDDVRLGPGWRWMPWQQALGAYGLDEACAQFGPASGRQLALRAAKAVVRDAFVKIGGQWTTKDIVALDGSPVTMGLFDLFGMPMAVAVVLRHEPWNAEALEIWGQIEQRSVLPKHTAWLVPGV